MKILSSCENPKIFPFSFSVPMTSHRRPFALTIFLSGKYGILILLVSTSLGIVPPLVGVGRNHLMGCLLLPVILYFI